MIALDSYSRQVFNYLDPILIYINLSTARLKLAELQSVSSGFRLPGHYRVTDEAFFFFAETT